VSVALDPKVERIKRISGTFMLLMWITKRRFLQLLQPFGLTPPQFMSLSALSMRKESYTMSDLTSVTLHDPPTMTGIVDRLVKMGLVQRSRSKTDRRVVLVQVTPVGLDLVGQIHESLLNDSQAAYEILTDEELAKVEYVFRYVLRQVRRHISVDGTDLDVELEKLESFMCDPIGCVKSESASQRVSGG
jgi:DNA-binding MarR family transcriptional regulator